MDYIKYICSTNRNLEDLSYELSKKVSCYGEHFSNPLEGSRTITTKKIIKSFVERYYHRIPDYREKVIQSNIYLDLNQYYHGHVKLKNAPWATLCFDDKVGSFRTFKGMLERNDVSIFYEEEFYKLKNKIENILIDYYAKNVSALLVPYDLPYFERKSIDIFKTLKRPNAVFLHGLPARYNNIDDNRADRLFVWGEGIKKNYINHGVPEEKIVITGHPIRDKVFKSKTVKYRNTLEKIVVLTKVSSGGRSDSTTETVYDRSNSLLYLELVKSALLKVGVEHVELRVHPSENSSWYKSMVDNNFFSINNDTLINTLKKSTTIISPASTVLINSIIEEVNFVLFEPCVEKKGFDIFGDKLVPPFDGSIKEIPAAFSVEELVACLKERRTISSDFLNEYIGIDFTPEIIIDYCLSKRVV